jgi:hypothetical protein
MAPSIKDAPAHDLESGTPEVSHVNGDITAHPAVRETGAAYDEKKLYDAQNTESRPAFQDAESQSSRVGSVHDANKGDDEPGLFSRLYKQYRIVFHFVIWAVFTALVLPYSRASVYMPKLTNPIDGGSTASSSTGVMALAGSSRPSCTSPSLCVSSSSGFLPPTP